MGKHYELKIEYKNPRAKSQSLTECADDLKELSERFGGDEMKHIEKITILSITACNKGKQCDENTF